MIDRFSSILLSTKTVTISKVIASLEETGLPNSGETATEMYDSFGGSKKKRGISLSFNGCVKTIHILPMDTQIEIDEEMPEADDLILLVGKRGNGFAIAKNLFNFNIPKNQESIEASKFVKLVMRPVITIVELPPMENNFLKSAFPSEGKCGNQFNIPKTASLVKLLDERWKEADLNLHDRKITVPFLEAFLNNKNPARPTVCVGTGCCEFAAGLAGRCSGKIYVYEQHPEFKALLSENSAISTTDKNWEDDGNARKLPDTIGIFPFVDRATYAAGHPSLGELSGPIIYPSTPMSVQDSTKPMKANESTGGTLIKMVVSFLFPGAIGAFLVPVGFGTLASFGIARNMILTMAEILEFKAISAKYAILIVQKRPLPIQIMISKDERNPASNGKRVRWIHEISVFVEDETCPGIDAGTAGKPTASSLIKEVMVNSSTVNFNAARDAGFLHLNMPENGAPVAGTNFFIGRECKYLNMINNPAIFIKISRAKNGLQCSKNTHNGCVAMGTEDYAVATASSDTLLEKLEAPGVEKWLSNVCGHKRLSVEHLMSIPI